jgi:hypothetical protein
MITTVANLAAMSWFGMWMGMTSKNNNLATLKTLLLVQVIPWMLIGLSSLVLIPLMLLPQLLKASGVNTNSATMTAIMSTWYPMISVGLGLLLNVGKNMGFLYWARARLYGSFREQAVRSTGMQGGGGAGAAMRLPPAQPALPAPPVIAGG